MRIRRFFEHLEGEAGYYQTRTWLPMLIKREIAYPAGAEKQIRQIDQKLKDKLLDLFPSLRKPIRSEKAYTSKSKLINGASIERVDIDILQSEDEWYYVRIIGMTGTCKGTRFFTCDQFEGLIDCLKNEVCNIKTKDNLFLSVLSESIDQNINHLIEDAFVPMCDSHSLDFRTMEGYFVNTIGSQVANQWIPHGLLDDLRFMFRDEGEQLIYKRAIQVTFLRSESYSNHYIGEISDEKKIESLNKELKECVKRFDRMNQTNYKLTNLPDEIKQSFWQIVFYLVED